MELEENKQSNFNDVATEILEENDQVQEKANNDNYDISNFMTSKNAYR